MHATNSEKKECQALTRLKHCSTFLLTPTGLLMNKTSAARALGSQYDFFVTGVVIRGHQSGAQQSGRDNSAEVVQFCEDSTTTCALGTGRRCPAPSEMRNRQSPIFWICALGVSGCPGEVLRAANRIEFYKKYWGGRGAGRPSRRPVRLLPEKCQRPRRAFRPRSRPLRWTAMLHMLVWSKYS